MTCKQNTMKKISCIIVVMVFALSACAQYERNDEADETKGFKKENLFTGGGLIVSFSSYRTVLGASPILGYSITKWLDAGLAFNYVYTGGRLTYSSYDPYTGYTQYYVTDDKLRQTTMGPGAFVRIYPVNFLFVQAQAEKNFINSKVIYSNGAPNYEEKLSAPSFLVGAGYCSGRYEKGSLFYYVSVMADIARDENSPYNDISDNGRVVLLPIVKAGLQIPLFQGRKNRRD